MSDDGIRVVLAGLPDTGKSTFLAGLWHVLESNEIQGALRLSSVPNDRRYLNAMRDAWIKGEAVGRTPGPTEQYLQFGLESAEGERFVINLPDLSGEAYRAIWTRRGWTETLETFASKASGLVLFVHPRQMIPAARADEADVILSGIRGHAPIAQEADKQVEPKFDPEKVPTATQLVDIIGALRTKTASKSLPTAVVISAWDLVKSIKEPATWLDRNLPLVSQYFKANAKTHPYRVFGVSAIGGNLDEPAQKKRLIEKPRASERIRVVDDAITDHDITRPLRWVSTNLK